MKYKTYKGTCPFCYAKNIFSITKDELDNNFDFSCSKCDKGSQLWNFNIEEVKE